MRDLKIAERRAELSADVQKLREQEEMDLAQREVHVCVCVCVCVHTHACAHTSAHT